ncbi:hypothetical protein [Mycobacteroides immunogenum]|jgi:hypothetical protein|uniref:Uncharacterized protein n=1 Tax=Mycobacteroides immunogenum TaxID=83262 RepID=A0A7V8LL87_9MYCO|nr:hypothetical protein [Mycobacteroides immunogenum]AMT72223.1 hypothetical protein ABG82_19930 [Mycobacteroides immunogenum]ANO05359.1 hypothetical protein BAB75_20195 [Mycobacteroides immunogenum]KIU40319.1 hypothetical protein TL11_12000 [Mycobacteroides immunogenum]KPG05761.1 hypothetical protein AN908_21955 [Mycobacteroides immunogenum]KPG12614.1 hypothetical protein AN909_07480 [Mycobacteroides immunogenum]
MAPPEQPREPHKFDYNSLPEADRKRLEAQARTTLHMEPEAGQTMAKLMLDAKHQIDQAIQKATSCDVHEGFNPKLSTGSDVTQHYGRESKLVLAELIAASEGCKHMADQFLAMEYAYLNSEANNTTKFGKWQGPDGKDTTWIEV